MGSCGIWPEITNPGLFNPSASSHPGIAPPVYSRIMYLISAAFRDPCACVSFSATLSPGQGSGYPQLPTAPTGTPAASLQISNLPSLPAGGPQIVSDPIPYDYYAIESDYTFDSGQRALPGSGIGPNGGKASVVTVHGGLMHLDVVWTASRRGAPPVVPTYTSPNPNIVGVDTPKITRPYTDYSPDLINQIFKIDGHYRYVVIDPTQVNMTAPVAPFLTPLTQYASNADVAYSTSILWGIQLSAPNNPFVPNGIVSNQPPSLQQSQDLGQIVETEVSAASASASIAQTSEMIHGNGSGGNAQGGGLIIGGGGNNFGF